MEYDQGSLKQLTPEERQQLAELRSQVPESFISLLALIDIILRREGKRQKGYHLLGLIDRSRELSAEIFVQAQDKLPTFIFHNRLDYGEVIHAGVETVTGIHCTFSLIFATPPGLVFENRFKTKISKSVVESLEQHGFEAHGESSILEVKGDLTQIALLPLIRSILNLLSNRIATYHPDSPLAPNHSDRFMLKLILASQGVIFKYDFEITFKLP
ncbi:MAG: hypothetical protein ACMG6E_03170 [Candidatus Roizmanbacteria bacterium]